MANGAAQRAEAPRPNNTGMPDKLKSGIESLSGFSMDNVRVHYNSSKPATVQALAYTQGTDIHVAPGQEKHLPHEAWHVAQQMAGRVSPTTNINGMPVNDNAALEHEADVMGEKAVAQRIEKHPKNKTQTNNKNILQRVQYTNINDLFNDFLTNQNAVLINNIITNVQRNPNTSTWYNDAIRNLQFADFVNDGSKPQTNRQPNPTNNILYTIHYGKLWKGPEMSCIALLHELMHIDSIKKYGQLIQIHNIDNKPENTVNSELSILENNAKALESTWENEKESVNHFNKKHIDKRIDYIKKRFFEEYDTVLGDLIYYMDVNNLQHTKTYAFANRMLAEANNRRNNPNTPVRKIDPYKKFWQFWKW